MDDAEVPSFRRARRPEQRELRRQEILDVTRALLAEMPAEEISLRELGRRLGVSKTHVVRYFESREGVFLEMLDRMLRSWLGALPSEWPTPPCASDEVMRAWADSLAARPELCQLWSLLPSVLERNVSTETLRAYKLAELEHRHTLTKEITDRIPELDTDDALTLTRYATVALVGLWPFSNPTPTVAKAAADPRLADSRMDFAAMYCDILRTTLTGLLARP